MYGEEGKQEMESIVRRIMYHENQQKIFQKLKWIRGKQSSGGIDYVIGYNDEGQESIIQDPEAIFSAIIQHNIAHFSQADATEVTRDPLKSILGPFGTNIDCDDILKGQFRINEIDCSNAAKGILRQLKRTLDTEIDDTIISLDLQRGYRKWGEYTTTSPSGLHLSHERAVLRYMESQRSISEATGQPTLCDRVFGIKAKLLQLAISHCHVFKRWTKVVNAMIEKIPGKPLLNKLRVIHLIESDFNLLIGILWGRRLVAHCEDTDQLDEGQGGSRPDRRTQELLIQKHLMYSIWRLAKINGTSFDNDAKSCFDRIVMPLASIASQQVGMTKRACNLFLSTLNQMQYHIKTSAGISEESYSTTDEYTIHGPGQGGRGSPSIWLIVSSLIMKVMKTEQSKGSHVSDPSNNITMTQHITGFVDDITHWYSTMTELEPTADITENITYTSQLWTQLLSVTGGKLELQKCFTYLVSWVFDQEGRARMATPQEQPLTIVLRDSETSQQFQITQKSSFESHKTLGVLECPCGDYRDEFTRLMTKAKGFAQILANSKLSRQEAKTLYFTIFIPSMNYSGAIGTLTLEQAKQIQGAVTQQFVSKMGFNRCLPIEITYGPPSLGGLGLRHLFHEQNTEKALFIVRLLRTNRPASKILRIQLAWAQLVAGTSSPILADTKTPLPQLENEVWISTLRQFLASSQLGIRMVHVKDKKTKCANDIFLMDCACNMDLSNRKIQMVNRCRIFLRAETLADVCSYSGKYIDPQALECTDQARIISPNIWPAQPRPGPQHRKIWKQFLLQFCHVGSTTLEQPLGPWTCPDPPIRVSCNTYFNTKDKSAVRINQESIESAEVIERRTYQEVGEFEDSILQPGSSLIPADILERNGKRRLEWRIKQTPLTRVVSIWNSWAEYIDQIPEWERQLISSTEWKIPEDQVIAILVNPSKDITAVSDGGCIESKGSYGWVIANQLHIMIEGHGRVPGQPMSSHRAEAFGKLSWITFLHHIALFHGITIQCSVRSFCDNKAIVTTTQLHQQYTRLSTAMCPNYDVLRSIAIKQQQLMSSTTNLVNTRYVQAHQDRKKKSHELSQEEHLNVRADELATQALLTGEEPNKDYILPHGAAFVSIGPEIVLSNEAQLLRWRLSEFHLQDYYSRTFKIKISDLHKINWAALRIAREKLLPGQKTFSMKHAIGWLATGNRMKMQGRILSECVRCGGEENTDHLYQCIQRTAQVTEIARQFERFLEKIDTNKHITDALSFGFRKWAVNADHRKGPNDTDILRATQAQNDIGWHLMVRGMIAKEWSNIQEARLDTIDKYTGDTWCSKVAHWWIQQSYDLWIIRNHELHETNGSKHTWKQDETHEQVRQLYDNEKYMTADDRVIFNVPLEIKLKETTESLQTWVKNMDPIVRICRKTHEENIKNQNKDIRTYYSVQDEHPTEDSEYDDDTSQRTVTLNSSHEIDPATPSPTTRTTPSDTNDARTQTEVEGIYLIQSSGELYPPDRVETPRAGDTDRAASRQE